MVLLVAVCVFLTFSTVLLFYGVAGTLKTKEYGVLLSHIRPMPRALDDANQGHSNRNVAQDFGHGQRVLMENVSQDFGHGQRVLMENVAQDFGHGQRVLTENEVAQRFQRRRELLRIACHRYGNSSELGILKVLTTPARRYPPVMNVTFGYCPIPKTSTTTWKRIFRYIDREMERRHVKGEKVKVPLRERDVLFTFVREPYGRLLSAYVDKIFSPDELFWRNIGRFIVNNTREHASLHSLQCGHDVTFPEFIQHFIRKKTKRRLSDTHFIPSHSHCGLCQHPYKYLGHLETWQEDMPFILKALQLPALIYNHTMFDYVTIQENSDLVLGKLRTKLTKCISVDEASRRLWKKWQIRGLIDKGQKFPLTDRDAVNITATRLRRAATAALGQSGPRSQRVGQKKEALREAFASVPLDDRLEVQRILFLDFQMFGFDPQPDDVFPRKPFKPDPDFSYFDLYSP